MFLRGLTSVVLHTSRRTNVFFSLLGVIPLFGLSTLFLPPLCTYWRKKLLFVPLVPLDKFFFPTQGPPSGGRAPLILRFSRIIFFFGPVVICGSSVTSLLLSLVVWPFVLPSTRGFDGSEFSGGCHVLTVLDESHTCLCNKNFH